MTVLLEWTHIATREQLAAPLAFFRPIAVRAALWGGIFSFAVIATLFVLTPDVFIPPLPILLACIAVCSPIYLLSFVRLNPTPTLIVLTDKGCRYRFTEKGDKRWRYPFKWDRALGWALEGEPADGLLLIGRGGQPTRLPLPTDQNLRRRLTTVFSSRLPKLTPIQLELYARQVELDLREIIWFSAFTWGNALLGGLIAPSCFKSMPNVFGLIVVFVVACLPSSLLALAYFRRRFPQYSYLYVPLLVTTLMLSSSLAMLFTLACLKRTLNT
jgi:hypothetical protein